MNKTYKLNLKTNETVFLKITNNDNVFNIDVYNNQQKPIASSLFKVDSLQYFIYRIEVSDHKFSRKGIGTLMLKLMESISKKHNCIKICGAYMPFGKLAEYSKDFYEKNGYNIYKIGYQHYRITKDLLKNIQTKSEEK